MYDYIVPTFDGGSSLDEYVFSIYNGVDHRLIANYYFRFIYDNLINIILVFILLNMI